MLQNVEMGNYSGKCFAAVITADITTANAVIVFSHLILLPCSREIGPEVQSLIFLVFVFSPLPPVVQKCYVKAILLQLSWSFIKNLAQRSGIPQVSMEFRVHHLLLLQLETISYHYFLGMQKKKKKGMQKRKKIEDNS